MKRIGLVVAYDGTNYCGWQTQPNGITVQGELNDTVQKLYEKYVPQATREYIDDKVAREISTRERTRRADRTVRREESQLEESEIV